MRHPLDDERRALASDPKHMEYARRIAEVHASKCWRFRDDILGAAYLGLCEAAATFDPSLGPTFLGFAESRIRGAIQDMQRGLLPRGYRRTREPWPWTLSMDWVYFYDPGEERYMGLAELVPSGDDPVGWEAEYQDEVELAAGLATTARDSEVIRFLHGHADCASVRGVAKRLGICEAWAFLVRRRAEATMAEKYAIALKEAV